ncbi:hypothetical protein OESDEN_23010 [Oesophagostomum dentatum]|uniref:SCP domain-containing protein n=1 Tax=Oesophagostomum dentatum TaxID=61180 RepID=A0A0B1S2B2_OESDE|nr:hypothetical protein OESDEN_23010 [Oesophagostomum dentatum]
MPTLTYNCDLEKSAYERAQLCSSLSSAAVPVGVSENSLNFTTRLDKRTPEKAATAIASDLTTQVGCAVRRCTDSINVVCHYNTTLTNAVKLYTCGPYCRKCPEGEQHCYIGMCPVA